MDKSNLETTDIFKGAFYLCMGSDLSDIRFNGKKIASFLFTGPDLYKHNSAYVNGRALVNPVQFRTALNHLRDILFERLRKGRYENDRKRKNRAYQKHY